MKNGWQITLALETARYTVVSNGVDVNGEHYALFGFCPDGAANPPAFVNAKMPYEMPDAAVKNILSQYGQIIRVQRRCYASPPIETGVRVFAIANPRELSLEHVN